jgi:hypothetical protein
MMTPLKIYFSLHLIRVCVRACVAFPCFQAMKSVPAIPYMDALPFNLAILDVLVNFTSVL